MYEVKIPETAFQNSFSIAIQFEVSDPEDKFNKNTFAANLFLYKHSYCK